MTARVRVGAVVAVLFLIALRMVFPAARKSADSDLDGEPFLVPLAIPLIAGPSLS